MILGNLLEWRRLDLGNVMGKKRILAIEDDMDVAELLIMYFDSQGYEVFHADSGGDGITLARSKLPNLILLDIMLPDMEGFEVCQALRQANLTKYIPIIFLTQRNARSDKISGLQIGADDYITKPFDVEELRIRVQSSIARATRDHLHEPITGLPAGPMVEDEYQSFLRQRSNWHRLDVRVAGFTGFKDAYGFLTANEALSLAAKVLSGSLVEMGDANDFIGTLEDAHFVVFTHIPEIEKYTQAVSKEFSERAKMLYRFTDVDQGYVLVDEKREPLMHFDIQVHAPVID
ncbi:MAG: response regulator transcription factor [Anaerolineae bacterium]|nr:MAG: response regulator transcription factor [Anaerolineae bacterium]